MMSKSGESKLILAIHAYTRKLYQYGAEYQDIFWDEKIAVKVLT